MTLSSLPHGPGDDLCCHIVISQLPQAADDGVIVNEVLEALVAADSGRETNQSAEVIVSAFFGIVRAHLSDVVEQDLARRAGRSSCTSVREQMRHFELEVLVEGTVEVVGDNQSLGNRGCQPLKTHQDFGSTERDDTIQESPRALLDIGLREGKAAKGVQVVTLSRGARPVLGVVEDYLGGCLLEHYGCDVGFLFGDEQEGDSVKEA